MSESKGKVGRPRKEKKYPIWHGVCDGEEWKEWEDFFNYKREDTLVETSPEVVVINESLNEE